MVTTDAAVSTAVFEPPAADAVPLYLLKVLAMFLSRGGTGNFIINIRDGKVMGGKLEELIKQT